MARPLHHRPDTGPDAEGPLPVCSYCHQVRDATDLWQGLEEYVRRHSQARFSHSICPACWTDYVEPDLRARRPPAPEPR